jgi:hypothetical protein
MNAQLDDKIAQYYGLGPTDFRIVKSLSLTQATDSATGEMRQNFAIVLAKDDSFSGDMLYIDLLGVRSLRLKQPSWSMISLSNLEITMAPATSKLDRCFLVRDAEQEAVLACSCDDFCVAVG